MSDRIFQRQKAAKPNSPNSSLVSPNIPTLANPTRGFGLQLDANASVSGNPSNEQTAEIDAQNLTAPEALKIQYHDISRISLKPQAQSHVVSLPTISRQMNGMIQRDEKEDPGLLTQAEVKSAHAYYASRSKQYTPDIIKQIQGAVGAEATGAMNDETIQAVAKWQEEHPPLKVDGKAGPRTLPAVFTTGLEKTTAVDKYVGEAKKVEADWATLKTADERADKLLKAVNEQLAAAGVPACNKKIKNLGAAAGQLDFPTWTMDLGKEAFSKETITDAEAAEVSNTVYHEARHAEQWFMMARMLAGKGKSAKAIAQEMGIPAKIASEAASKPLKKGSMEALIAEGWYDSVYGAQAEYRNQVLNDVLAKKTALTKAQEQYDKSPTEANKAKLEIAQKKFAEAYKKYRDLPEENDAGRVGDAAAETYLKK